MSPVDRRAFLHHSVVLGALGVAGPLRALLARAAKGAPAAAEGYGPLAPVADEATGLPLLLLPAGFRYVSFGWTGDAMSDRRRTPPAHDGMAAFAAGPGRVRLVRNHETGHDRGAFSRSLAYDPNAGGGTTTLEFDTRRGRFLGSRASIAGTAVNCAGGSTPWGSWLTCEETVVEPAPENRFRRPHGYIFEVPAEGRPTLEPLTAMGRFVHEAVAIDPADGTVYETEDRVTSGFYRFLPERPGRLAAGGRLQMLAVEGRPQLDTRVGQRQDVTYEARWVDIADPDRAHADPGARDRGGVFMQGFEQGGTVFGRLEGAWYGNGRIYFVSTSGGNAGKGQVWEYEPAASALRLIFESPGAAILNNPDNICVSPRGGLVLCEDGSGPIFLHGLTTDGRIFRFARNNVALNGERNGFRGNFADQEFAGATYSPDGEWLFVNIQTPGITLAITGPWGTGKL